MESTCYIMYGWVWLHSISTSPMQFYETYEECLIVARQKRDLLIMRYAEHGYYITESKAVCEQQPVT